jgi:predicted PurR-regulated permease PerM
MLVEWGKGLLKPDVGSIEQMPIVQRLLAVGRKLSEYLNIDFNAVQSRAIEGITQAGTAIAGLFGAFLAQIPDWGFQFFMFTLFLIWFLLEAKKLRKGFNWIADRSGFDSGKFVTVWRLHSQSVLISNAITGVVQALIIAIGGLVFGVGNFFVVLMITFICSFIPVIGAAPVGVVMALFCLFDSKIGAGIGLLIISAGTGLIDNILRPYLLKGDTETSPLLSLFAVIGGVIVMGLPGLFIAPLVLSLAIATLPILFKNELVEVENSDANHPPEIVKVAEPKPKKT